MTSSYLDHPSEESLERFLLHHAQEDELDRVETHILACHACVSRLEELEIQMAATKLALTELSREPQLESSAERRSPRQWFTFQSLSWAGAVAALALVATLTPRFVSHTGSPVDVTLSANRGSGAPAIPQGRPLHMHLSAQDVPNGPLQVVVVEGTGLEVWKGLAKAQSEHVELTVPQLEERGTHFLRLYAVRSDNSAGELLREFPFEVK